MTNAEKFKEVFGIDFEYNLENVCPRPHTGVCYYDDDGDEDCDTCVYEYWENNEYQGEPTIPLSVIEKITETMEVEYASADELADWFSDGDKTEASFYRGKASGIKWVKGIIDKAVKECEI